MRRRAAHRLGSLLAVVLVACGLTTVVPVALGPAAPHAVSATDLDNKVTAFVNATRGQTLANAQGGYAGECVSLVSQYLLRVWGITSGAWGNAVDYRSGGSGGNQLASRGFTWSTSQSFVNGDILVWGPDAGAGTGSAGHIGIWANGAVYDQNDGRHTPARTANYSSFWSGGFLGRWRKESGSSPRGAFDTVEAAGGGKIRVRGWAVDDDQKGTPLQVHIYVGGPSGSGEGHAITANAQRSDVGAAFPGVGDYHGFDATLDVGRFGNQAVYAYAINVGGTGGDNVLLGTKSVTVQEKVPDVVGGGTTVPGSSNPTTQAPSGTVALTNSVRPSIAGKAKAGRRVRAVAGAWAPSDGTTFRYQWYAGKKAIRGATSSTLKVTGRLRGKRVSVRVTAVRAGSQPTTVSSRARRVR